LGVGIGIFLWFFRNCPMPGIDLVDAYDSEAANRVDVITDTSGLADIR
jgi:hypothetical protein